MKILEQMLQNAERDRDEANVMIPGMGDALYRHYIRQLREAIERREPREEAA